MRCADWGDLEYSDKDFETIDLNYIIISIGKSESGWISECLKSFYVKLRVAILKSVRP